MKIGEIWQQRSKPCALCPFQELTVVKILGLKQDHYSHSITWWHPCTGITKPLFFGEGYGDVVIYEYLGDNIFNPGERGEMAREAFIILWEPCYELIAT
jgi:hypothetical protein